MEREGSMVAYQEISQSSVGRSVRVGLGKLLVAGALSLLGWEVLGPNTARAERAQGEAWLGSYGRVGFSSDESGGEGDRVAITPYAPRLIEDNYLELDASYRAHQGPEATVDITTTLSLFDAFFHYDGVADASWAIRRAFIEARELWGGPLWLSLGSRWLRGNDIYLMNMWPLDNLNTMGLTLGARGPRYDAQLHLGVNRLNSNPLSPQVQRVAVPSASGFGADQVLLLDRQRLIASALFERRAAGWKWKLYGELHRLPSGERALEGSYLEREELPDDLGLMVGAQLGLWGMWSPQDHLNLWARYAKGLAVYDELGPTGSLNLERRSWSAEEWRLALAGNLAGAKWSAQWGGYVRYFRDADRSLDDFDDRLEGSFALRPQLNLGAFTPAMELSAQLSEALGAHPIELTRGLATVYQLGLIPAFSFGGGAEVGSFTRPQLRLMYVLSWVNEAARARYAPEDPQAHAALRHYLGARAEWWFGRGGGY